MNDGKEAIVTSQPFVPGEASTDEEVAALMAERGFAVVPSSRRATRLGPLFSQK
jgi:hypothetical protein